MITGLEADKHRTLLSPIGVAADGALNAAWGSWAGGKLARSVLRCGLPTARGGPARRREDAQQAAVGLFQVMPSDSAVHLEVAGLPFVPISLF